MGWPSDQSEDSVCVLGFSGSRSAELAESEAQQLEYDNTDQGSKELNRVMEGNAMQREKVFCTAFFAQSRQAAERWNG